MTSRTSPLGVVGENDDLQRYGKQRPMEYILLQ